MATTAWEAFTATWFESYRRGLLDVAKVLLFVANPSRTDRDKLSQSVPKAVGVQGEDGRPVPGAQPDPNS